MTNDDKLVQLLAYLDGELTGNEQQQLDQELAIDEALRKKLEELKAIREQLAALPLEQPSADMTGRFQQYLLEEKQDIANASGNSRLSWIKDWRFAAASVLILLGFGLGFLWQNNRRQQAEILSLQEEMHNTQRMMVLATLDKPSASERIRAVNVLQKEEADPEIIEALVQTMNLDDMTNVRMKAVQALARFGNDPVVKDALIHSLPQQKSPEVQIAIIDALVAIGEKRAVPVLQEVSRDKDRLDIVRQKAASGVEKLI